MSIKRFILLLPLLLLMVVSLPASHEPTYAQDDDACEAMIRAAVQQIGSACATMGQNEACYGHTQVAATLTDPTLIFDESGDIVDVVSLEAIFTRPADPNTGEWGVAQMAVQADLPTGATEPVYLVMFGGVEVEAEAPAMTDDRPTCDFSIGPDFNLNMRSGPGTNYTIVDVLQAGGTEAVYATNVAQDWVRSSRGWMAADLGTLTCEDDAALQVVEQPEDLYVAPMQRFTMQVTGSGQCAGAPSGMMIQVPDGQTANIMVNGVELRIASTAYLSMNSTNTRMWVGNVAGNVRASSLGHSARVGLGQGVPIDMNDDMNPAAIPGAAMPMPAHMTALHPAFMQAMPNPVSMPTMSMTTTTTMMDSSSDSSSTSMTPPGQWGACGSCSTCGFEPSQCVINPDGACVWDPSGCGGLSGSDSGDDPGPGVLECGGPYTCPVGGSAAVFCFLNGTSESIDDYYASSQSGLLGASASLIEPQKLLVTVDCSGVSTPVTDTIGVYVYDTAFNMYEDNFMVDAIE